MKFWWWRFRVCVIGWRMHQHWPLNDLYRDEWEMLYEDMGNDPEEAYIEGWCRE